MGSQYVRTQILLHPETRSQLDRIARQEDRSVSDLVREMLQHQLVLHNRNTLAEAARALLPDYEAGGQLTAFTALDGEDLGA